MSADLSAPASAAPRPETAISTSRQPEPPKLTSLDRPAAIAPAPTGKRGATTSLFRLRRYMLPFRTRFTWMFVVGILGVGATLSIPLMTRAVIDGPVLGSDRRMLIALGLLAVGLGICEAALLFCRRWIVAKATLGTETGIRTDLYAKLQTLPMPFHGQWQSGQLLSRIMNDLSTVRRFLGFGLLFIVTSVLQIIGVAVVLTNLYWPLGLVVILSSVPVILACRHNAREYTRLSRKIQDETGDVASTVEEGAQGLRVIKAFGRSEHIYRTFDRRAVTLYDTSMQRIRLVSKFWTFLEVIPALTLIVVLCFGALAAGQGNLTLGTLVAFMNLMLSLVGPMASLGMLLSQAQDAMTAADRIAEIFDTENEITDGDKVLENPVGRLEFHHAAFRFPDADSDVLSDINLDIAPGETVALVGSTGAGKSVLTALVSRLFDVTAGKVTIDGVDVRDLKLDQLRTVVATAFEDPTLFSMSARENLTLGRPNASDEDVAEAIDVAQAHFVYDLPWGLNTRIGEQGMSLSGGQRQRLALARAVLAKPRVLVLDDTLSALDIHTEALVEEALKRVLVGVTGIVVAHRASTVLLADKVALLHDGTISHVGKHSQLLATVPEYRELLSADPNLEELLDELEGEPNRDQLDDSELAAELDELENTEHSMGGKK